MDHATHEKSKQILKSASAILLVDWPNPSVPYTLLRLGYTVFSYSPGGYSQAKLVAQLPQEINPQSIFLLKDYNDDRYLIFQKLKEVPSLVDIVNIFRPEKELPEIILKHVLPLKAKAIWIQPPASSVVASSLAQTHDLILIQDHNIEAVATEI
jgi:CoA binding domain